MTARNTSATKASRVEGNGSGKPQAGTISRERGGRDSLRAGVAAQCEASWGEGRGRGGTGARHEVMKPASVRPHGPRGGS